MKEKLIPPQAPNYLSLSELPETWFMLLGKQFTNYQLPIQEIGRTAPEKKKKFQLFNTSLLSLLLLLLAIIQYARVRLRSR